MAPEPDLAAGLALGGAEGLEVFFFPGLSLDGCLPGALEVGVAWGFILTDEKFFGETIYPRKMTLGNTSLEVFEVLDGFYNKILGDL